MIRTILVHVQGDGQDELALDLGLAWARLFGAHLECLHVRRSLGSILWRAPPSDILTAGLGGDLVAPLEAADEDWSRRARDAYEAFCSTAGLTRSDRPRATGQPTASWRETVGGLEQLLRRARFNDLVVDRRPLASGDAPERLGRLVLGCGRPVLVPPQEPPVDLSGTVAIAWKDTLEAARAMSAAQPFLMKARRIVLLTAPERPGTPVEGMSDALAWLAWRGLEAEARPVDVEGASVALAVTQAAVQEGAGLMIAGAYGRHRSFELALGGFTQDILDACQLPVLMLH